MWPTCDKSCDTYLNRRFRRQALPRQLTAPEGPYTWLQVGRASVGMVQGQARSLNERRPERGLYRAGTLPPMGPTCGGRARPDPFPGFRSRRSESIPTTTGLPGGLQGEGGELLGLLERADAGPPIGRADTSRRRPAVSPTLYICMVGRRRARAADYQAAQRLVDTRLCPVAATGSTYRRPRQVGVRGGCGDGFPDALKLAKRTRD
jgi:hypothetical protein